MDTKLALIVPKILLVDDRHENLIALKRLLDELEAECHLAHSGDQALELLAQHEYALALIDVQMPDMNGFELLEKLRQQKSVSYVPVIFVSAIYSDEFYQHKGIIGGAVDFITKPIIPEILQSKARIFLDLYTQRKALEIYAVELDKTILELRREEELYSIIVDHISAGVAVVDSTLRKVKLNNQLLEWFPDLAKHDEVQCGTRTCCFGFDNIVHRCPVRKTLADGQVHELLIEDEKGQSTRIFRILSSPVIADGKPVGAVELVEDVSEKERMQQLMLQTEKMLSVAGLAAGMAHEINNPLSIIVQGVQSVKRHLEPNLPRNAVMAEKYHLDLDKVRCYFQERGTARFLDGIAEAGSRAAHIIQNMLKFARPERVEKSKVNLCELLDRTLDLAAKDYKLKKHCRFDNINIVKEYEKNIPLFYCDPSQLEQIFFNLFKNTAEAFCEHQYDQPELKICLETHADSICVTISDNGPGMDANTRKRVFEPFFTTKPVGIGTGLGLYVAYLIVKQCYHGEIEVRSKPGEGTQFIVTLPVS